MQKTMRKQTVLYGASKYATVAVTLLTTAVLSRLLTPAEFGVITVVTVFTAFFSVLSDMGLGTAVIQNKTLTKSETSDIFSFSIYCALALAVMFALLGIPIAAFYGDPVYQKICLLLSISVLFNAMNIIPNAVLMKDKRFALAGKRLIVTALISGAIAIVMAKMGAGYRALIAQSISQAAFIFFWNYCNSGLRFRMRVNMDSVVKVRQFSIYQFLFSLINYFARNLDNLLIGKVMGSENLAYYDKGYKLMMYPIQNLTYVVNPILHPILSDYQNDRRRIFNSYLSVVRVLSILGVGISAVCFSASREIVLLFFGGQWERSVPIFSLLSVSVWPQLVSSTAGAIYQSTGNTRLMFRSGMIHFGLSIACIAVGVMTKDLQKAAALVCFGLYARFFIDYYFLIAKNFRYSYFSFLATFRLEVLSAAILALAIILLSRLHVESMLLSLTVKCVSLGALYLAILAATGQLRELFRILKIGKNRTGETNHTEKQEEKK